MSDDAPRRPVGLVSYEQFAGRYAAAEPTKAHTAHYNRPALLALLPDVHGKRVLDAGCGGGRWAAELVDRGATVVAVDVTPEMVRIARERLGSRATVLEADLEQPLRFAGDAEFDVVFSSLAFDYIEDWTALMREIARILRPGGALLFSVEHPWGELAIIRKRGAGGADYFATERYTLKWTGFGEPHPEVTSYRRPLGATFAALLGAGLVLEAFVEPRPTPEFRDADPEEYEALMRDPGFLCIRAGKPG